MTAAAPQFRLPRRSFLHDLAMVVICIAIVGGFLVHAWRAPAPEPVRTASQPASLRVPA